MAEWWFYLSQFFSAHSRSGPPTGDVRYIPISASNAASFFGCSGISVIVASVSSRTLATDTAFSRAILMTFVGSMMPASTRSTYSLRLASKP